MLGVRLRVEASHMLRRRLGLLRVPGAPASRACVASPRGRPWHAPRPPTRRANAPTPPSGAAASAAPLTPRAAASRAAWQSTTRTSPPTRGRAPRA
eukprot:1288017-Prymnesium_polylepis.2